MTTRTCPKCGEPTMIAATINDELRWTCTSCYCDDGQVYGGHAWLGLVVFAGVAIVGVPVVLLIMKAMP